MKIPKRVGKRRFIHVGSFLGYLCPRIRANATASRITDGRTWYLLLMPCRSHVSSSQAFLTLQEVFVVDTRQPRAIPYQPRFRFGSCLAYCSPERALLEPTHPWCHKNVP